MTLGDERNAAARFVAGVQQGAARDNPGVNNRDCS
jgi:hypothetical protein